MKRNYTLRIDITAPHTTGEAEISQAINRALDEPPCDWNDWEVGAAVITSVQLLPDEAETDAD